MAVLASFDGKQGAVDPGSVHAIPLRVRNESDIVDELRFEALGPAAGWISVEPDVLPLFARSEGMVQVLLRPPPGPSAPAGPNPFAVRVASRQDPASSVVEEGVVEITRYDEVSLELVPRTSRSCFSARHRLAVRNGGNAPVAGALVGRDPDRRTRLRLEPSQVQAPAGEVAFATVRVRPTRRFWRGPPQTHAFTVELQRDGLAPVATAGTMVQAPILPDWALRGVLASLAALLALFILWQTVLKPTVRSTARAAVAGPVAQAVQAGEQAEEAGQQASQAATEAKQAAEQAGAGAGATETTVPPPTTEPPPATTTTLIPLGDPTDFRLDASSPNHTVAANQVFSLTDFVFQNPAGDTGRIALLRGDATLWESSLENFRDLDFHFVSPYVFRGGEVLTLRVNCATPGSGDACSAAASVAGFTRNA